MMPTGIARLIWAALTLPLSVIFWITIAATGPTVLDNTAPRLALVAFVILSPLFPLILRTTSLRLIVGGTALSLIAQVLAFGFLNFWF
jgi:hypothetical protein